MKNFLYVLFNTLACRYGDVLTYPTDGFAISRIKKIAADPQSGLNISEQLLFKVGTIDLITGKVESLEPVPIPMENISSELPPGE